MVNKVPIKPQFSEHESSPVAIIGAGGHARIVITALIEAGYPIGGLFDDDVSRHGQEMLGVKILGRPEACADYGLRRGIVAVGDNANRQRLVQRLPGWEWITLIHPQAYVYENAHIGPGTVVMLGAIVRPNVVIGNHAIINTCAVVGHDSTVGDFAHLAGSSHMGGNSHVEEGAMLGLGAITIPGVRVGAWATIGAGGVVVKEIPPHATAVGVPA